MRFRLPAALAVALGLLGALPHAAGAEPSAAAPTCPMPAHWGNWTADTKLPDPDAVNVLRLGPGGALYWNNAPSDEASLDTMTVYLMKHPVDDLTVVLDPGGQDCQTVNKYRKKLQKIGCRKNTCLIGQGPRLPEWQAPPAPPQH